MEVRKLSKHEKIKLIILAENRHRRNLRRKYLKNDPYFRKKQRKKYKKTKKSRYQILLSPGNLDIYDKEQAHKSHKFLWQLREALYKNKKFVKIDFRPLVSVSAAATLNLVAEIHRAKLILKKEGCVTCIKPINERVRQVFLQIGLSKLLNYKDNIEITDPMVSFWKFSTGTFVEGQRAGSLLEKLGDILSDELRSNFFVAATEALTNAVQHSSAGYRSDNIPILDKRWWMFAGIYQGRFVMVVCDLGIGIPASIKINWKDQLVSRILSRLSLRSDDGAYIRVAMELKRSSTRLEHRGKGMSQLKEVLEKAGSGHLVVHSNKGVYTYMPSRDAVEQHYAQQHGISGTTIEWSLPVEQVNQAA